MKLALGGQKLRGSTPITDTIISLSANLPKVTAKPTHQKVTPQLPTRPPLSFRFGVSMEKEHPYYHLVSKENLQLYIQKAEEEKKGIYSVNPEVSPHQIKYEVEVAKQMFGHFIAEEKKRIKCIADKENMRLMKLRRDDEEDAACPLCLEDIPAIYSLENHPMYMDCCGVRLCQGCSQDWEARQDPTKEMICFSCRRPVNRNSAEEAALHGSEYRKGIALVDKATDLHIRGKFQEALDCIKKAADLGFESAYSQLAIIYYYGDFLGFKVEKSKKMAKETAQKGTDKGSDACTALLAHILLNEEGNHSEYVRLLSIAAYQGNPEAMRSLANYYNEKEVQTYQTLMLSIYWSGKVLETRTIQKDHFVKDSHMIFVTLVEHAMRQCWHKRSYFDLEPLPGCSHAPFCNWMRRRREKQLHDCSNNSSTHSGDVLYHMKCSTLMEICANCGNREKEKLKVCARCKSFSYCSKECQIKHWKAGHRVDCKGHWIEEFFPNIWRTPSIR